LRLNEGPVVCCRPTDCFDIRVRKALALIFYGRFCNDRGKRQEVVGRYLIAQTFQGIRDHAAAREGIEDGSTTQFLEDSDQLRDQAVLRAHVTKPGKLGSPVGGRARDARGGRKSGRKGPSRKSHRPYRSATVDQLAASPHRESRTLAYNLQPRIALQTPPRPASAHVKTVPPGPRYRTGPRGPAQPARTITTRTIARDCGARKLAPRARSSFDRSRLRGSQARSSRSQFPVTS